MEACQTDRGTLSLLSERWTFDHGSVRLHLIVRRSVRLRLRVRLRRVHKARSGRPNIRKVFLFANFAKRTNKKI